MEKVLQKRVEWQSPDENIKISRAEQDRQEQIFQCYQEKVFNDTITKQEWEELFYIIHNCVLAQIRRRIKGIKRKQGVSKTYYDSEIIEGMCLDATTRMLRRLKRKKSPVKYIIKSADYLALYEMHAPNKKFNDKIFRRGVSLDKYDNTVMGVDKIEIDDKGDIEIKSEIKERGDLFQ